MSCFVALRLVKWMLLEKVGRNDEGDSIFHGLEYIRENKLVQIRVKLSIEMRETSSSITRYSLCPISDVITNQGKICSLFITSLS